MSEQRVLILGTVTPGRERYCPILADHLDKMWPGHPPLYFALPSQHTAPYERVISTDATAWTTTLLRGLEHLQGQLGATHVFMLLEDHVPLWPCCADLLAAVIEAAVEEGLDCVFFNKYEWTWPSNSKAQGEVVTVRSQPLARMPRDFRHYNQCQPAVWNLDYYRRVVAETVRRGITDPWAFEAFAMPGQAQHYLADYQWPSRPSGYRRNGKVYWRALYVMKMPEGRALRDELLRELFPSLPAGIRGALGGCLNGWGRLRGLPAQRIRAARPSMLR